MDIAAFQFAAGGGVKIAIDAACLAKGNMDVDACHEPVNWLGCKYTIFSVCRLSGSSSLLVFNIKMDIEMRKDCVFSVYLRCCHGNGIQFILYEKHNTKIYSSTFCSVGFLCSLRTDVCIPWPVRH